MLCEKMANLLSRITHFTVRVDYEQSFLPSFFRRARKEKKHLQAKNGRAKARSETRARLPSPGSRVHFSLANVFSFLA